MALAELKLRRDHCRLALIKDFDGKSTLYHDDQIAMVRSLAIAAVRMSRKVILEICFRHCFGCYSGGHSF
jgi:hypothetical protein